MSERIIKGEPFNIVIEGKEGAQAVVLAHPMGGDLHLFDPIVPALLRHFRVIRYDMRGHGSSVATPGPYSLDQLGRDALAILDAIGFRKVHWIGLSFGAITGLWLMIHARERINRAVLASVAAHLGGAERWNERIRMVEEKGMEGVAPSVLENWFTKSFRERNPKEVERVSEILLATPEEGYTATCAAIRDMDLREAIRAITNPVLVIAGRHD
ncbi:MAG TPA: alpha/beta fold hydrolase, partial [Methylovirgula sp.]